MGDFCNPEQIPATHDISFVMRLGQWYESARRLSRFKPVGEGWNHSLVHSDPRSASAFSRLGHYPSWCLQDGGATHLLEPSRLLTLTVPADRYRSSAISTCV